MKFLSAIASALFLFTTSSLCFSQGEIIDDFSLKALPDWIAGGVKMTYSHEEDNKENGFAEITSSEEIKPGAYIGKIFLNRPHLFQPGNFVNIMIDGAKNDAYVTLKLLYDLDNNSRYEEDKDAALESQPVSMDFSGWKELKIKLDQDNFKLVTNAQVGFEVTEDEALGVQLDFTSGQGYSPSVFKSGIAIVSEIQSKETPDEGDTPRGSEVSFFNASNSPNPFNPVTTITYTLPQSTHVNISVYDRLGRFVEELVNSNLESGTYSVEFNAANLPSGIYFYRIKTSESTEVRKMLLSK